MTSYYLQHFLSSPSTMATLGVLLIVAVLVASLARQRRGLVLATGMSAALVGGFTLAPADGWTTFTVSSDPVAAVVRALWPHLSDLTAWRWGDGPANVALFVPLGFTLALLLRRVSTAVVIGVLLSVAIEAYQAATGTRVGVFADVVANGLGTVLGAVAAGAWSIVRRTPRRIDHKNAPVARVEAWPRVR